MKHLSEGDPIPFNEGYDILFGPCYDGPNSNKVLSMKHFVKIPNSEKMMNVVDPITFEEEYKMCIMWAGFMARPDGRCSTQTFWIPVEAEINVDEVDAYDRAIKII